jgi:hypothetical protein
MSDIPRSADSAYYASKQKLIIRQTREGSRNRRQIISYQQKPGDSSASSDKYYASREPVIVVDAPKLKKSKVVMLHIDENLLRSGLLQQVIRHFSEGCNDMTVTGSREQIDKAKISVDLAVGRNVLTRSQADQISFAEKADVVISPVAPIKKEPVDQIVEALKSMFSTDATVDEKPTPKKRGRKSKKEIEERNANKLDDADDD